MNKRIQRGTLLALNIVLLASSIGLPSFTRANASYGASAVASSRGELAQVAQHLAYICYELVACASKDKAKLSNKELAIVDRVERSYELIIDRVRSALYGAESSEYEASSILGNYVLELCHEFGVRSNYFVNFPVSVHSVASLEGKIGLIKRAVDALEKRFARIRPIDPFLTRAKNKLFYNFVTTRLIPQIVKLGLTPAVGLIGTAYTIDMLNDSHPTPTTLAACGRLSIPIIIASCLYGIGNLIEEAQLPKYHVRIREREQEEQEKRIQQEMYRTRINEEKEIGFAQIKGLRDLIDREMQMMVDYLCNPFKYKNSASGMRSLLMYGPPGTGKTLMARAIAKESGAPFLEISADDILGENSKAKVLATMRMAEQVASQRPEKSAIICIDEIDTVTGNRDNGVLDAERSKALANLLSLFDGVQKRNPFVHIVVIITTNHYKHLDPSLLRPGRIDRKTLISLPDAAGREEFFEELLPAEHKNYTEWLVKQTTGYSGAQIVNTVDTAQMIASYNGRSLPERKDYEAALQNSKIEQEAIPENAKVY